MARQTWKAEYKIEKWDSLVVLEALLENRCNDGWRVEYHRLAEGESGWTIFCRTTTEMPLLDRYINVGAVYSILNKVLEPGSDNAREFDAAIKEAVKQDGDTW